MIIATLILIGIIFTMIFFLTKYSLKYNEYKRKETLRKSTIETHKDIINNFEIIKKLKRHTLNSIPGKGISHLSNESGIYMIYIDIPKKEIHDVIPFYIGKAVDIRKRWKQHYSGFIKGYNGEDVSTKYQKFITYLQRKNIKPNKIKFVVLTTCTEDELYNKEKKYIDKYKSNVYGFNAIK